MTYSPQSPPPASPWGWDLSYEAGARRRGRAIPGGAPGTVSTPRTRRGIRETKPCSGGCGPAARSTCPRCSPSAGLRPGPPGRTAARPPCLPSPQDVSLGHPGGPPWPVRPHRSPGPRNWLPHALPGRCESRPLSRWWGGAAAFSGVLHPGHGLVSPLCSPQKLCPLAPVLGEHGRRSGSQPPVLSCILGVVFNSRGEERDPVNFSSFLRKRGAGCLEEPGWARPGRRVPRGPVVAHRAPAPDHRA